MHRELVRRAMERDHEAFTELVDASADRLYAVASLILRDRDAAEDAVQEALISAWRDIQSLRAADAWEAWLHRLTVWACYRVARKARRRSVVELHAVSSHPARESQDHSNSVAERDRLWRRLGELPIDQRAVIVLHFYLDRPLTEAADILDIPVGTAKSRLHRGLESLRSAMSDDSEARSGARQGVA